MIQRIRLATIIPLLMMTCLLTACGFQLRGKVDIKSDLSRVAVYGTNAQFIRDLSKAFNNNGITVTDAAVYQINILQIEKKTGNKTQPSAGRYERQLTFTVTYQLVTNDGLALFSPVSLSNSRYITYDQNQVNAAESEENIAYQELSQDLIYTAVRRVAGISQVKLEEEVIRARQVQQMELQEPAGGTALPTNGALQ